MNAVLVTYPYEREFEGKREPLMRARWQTRNATLKLLGDLGIRPHVQTSDPNPSAVHNRLNAIRAIQAVSGPVLFFEDDIIPTRDLLDWLPKCEAQKHIVQLCSYRLNDLPGWVRTAVNKREPITPQFVSVGHWGGAQALFLPEKVADAIRTDEEAMKPAIKHGPFDAYLRRTFRKAVCVIPNPVQHASPPSLVRTRPPRISQTFAHPTT